MAVAIWISQTIDEFGRTLGFEELALDHKGVLQLEIEDHGVLGLEHARDDVLVYLIREVDSETGTYRRALQMCHHSQSDSDWLQATLLGEGRLAFVLRIPSSEFHLASLEDAIGTLAGLHDDVAEGVSR